MEPPGATGPEKAKFEQDDYSGLDFRVIDDKALRPEQREYLQNRWNHELRLFVRQTRKSKRLNTTLSLVSISAGALTAFTAALGASVDNPVYRWITAVLGLVTAISTGAIGLFKPQENWINRSMTVERLRSEARMFVLSAGRYRNSTDPDEKFRLFAETVEAAVAEHKSRSFEHTQAAEKRS